MISLALRSGSPFPASPNSFKLTLFGPRPGQDAPSVYSFFLPTSPSNHQPHALPPPPWGTTSLHGLSSVNLRVLFLPLFSTGGERAQCVWKALPPSSDLYRSRILKLASRSAVKRDRTRVNPLRGVRDVFSFGTHLSSTRGA